MCDLYAFKVASQSVRTPPLSVLEQSWCWACFSMYEQRSSLNFTRTLCSCAPSTGMVGTRTHATQLLPIYKLTAKYGYMTAPDFLKQLPFFLQLLIPIHCSKKRPNVLTHSFCVKKNLSLSLTDIQYLVSRFCCSAIQCCKISHFPFSFLFSKHYFVVVFDHLCMFAEHLPLCPPQVWSLLRWMWKFLCGHQVSPQLWTPEKNWWKSSKINWRMTNRGETACFSVPLFHTRKYR